MGVKYKTIEGFSAYRVGTDGSIWSRWKRVQGGWALGDEWWEMMTTIDEGGYRTCGLHQDGKNKTVRLPNLLLRTFRGPPPKGHVACHNNGNSVDDRLSNLRWDTQANNIADKVKHGTVARGSKNGKARLTEDKVRQIRQRRKAGKTLAWIANTFKVSQSTAQRVCSGESWKHVK